MIPTSDQAGQDQRVIHSLPLLIFQGPPIGTDKWSKPQGAENQPNSKRAAGKGSHFAQGESQLAENSNERKHAHGTEAVRPLLSVTPHLSGCLPHAYTKLYQAGVYTMWDPGTLNTTCCCLCLNVSRGSTLYLADGREKDQPGLSPFFFFLPRRIGLLWLVHLVHLLVLLRMYCVWSEPIMMVAAETESLGPGDETKQKVTHHHLWSPTPCVKCLVRPCMWVLSSLRSGLRMYISIRM